MPIAISVLGLKLIACDAYTQAAAADPGAVATNVYRGSKLLGSSPVQWAMRAVYAPPRDGATTTLHAACTSFHNVMRHTTLYSFLLDKAQQLLFINLSRQPAFACMDSWVHCAWVQKLHWAKAAAHACLLGACLQYTHPSGNCSPQSAWVCRKRDRSRLSWIRNTQEAVDGLFVRTCMGSG